jgi:D-alanine--poly(phosphoribitol) ligase subunit 1
MLIPDVIDSFLAGAARWPQRAAIRLRGQESSYEAFEDRVRRFAAAFAERGAERVMIALPQGGDAYAAMLGAGLAGCLYAPANAESPAERLQRIAGALQPQIVVAEPALAKALATAAPQAALVTGQERLPAPLAGRGRRHEIAYVMFTSGTTGTPKGVVVPRAALDHYAEWIRRSGTVAAHDRVAQFSNIAFDVSVTDIYGALALGATLYPVVGGMDRNFPARMIEREKLTVWNSTPSVISLMMRAGEVCPQRLASLRLVNMLGEPLLGTHLEAIFRARPDLVVQNTYGPTETTVSVTELLLRSEDYSQACASSVAIGAPIEGMGLHLIGGAHPDEGEIAITGPQLALGYWNDAQRTAASFRAIRVAGEERRAYFTGDWAERKGGRIYFRERIDLQVKIRGFRLELDEVARALNDLGFAVVCVFKRDEELAALIEGRAEPRWDEARVRAALARRLESYAVPAVVRWIDHLPRNANDKLDRRAAADWLEARMASERAARAPAA